MNTCLEANVFKNTLNLHVKKTQTSTRHTQNALNNFHYTEFISSSVPNIHLKMKVLSSFIWTRVFPKSLYSDEH